MQPDGGACSQQPGTYTEVAAYARVDVAMISGDFIGPAHGNVSVRKLHASQQKSLIKLIRRRSR